MRWRLTRPRLVRRGGLFPISRSLLVALVGYVVYAFALYPIEIWLQNISVETGIFVRVVPSVTEFERDPNHYAYEGFAPYKRYKKEDFTVIRVVPHEAAPVPFWPAGKMPYAAFIFRGRTYSLVELERYLSEWGQSLGREDTFLRFKYEDEYQDSSGVSFHSVYYTDKWHFDAILAFDKDVLSLMDYQDLIDILDVLKMEHVRFVYLTTS